MSTDPHSGHATNGKPVHSTVTFEPRDIDIGTVARYLVYLALTIAFALLLCVPILKMLTSYVAQQDPPLPPVRAAMTQQQRDEKDMPMEPRLQGIPGHVSDPQQDMREKIQNDTAVNNMYAWVDKDKGIAQIPVAEAMKIIAQKGALPAQEKKP